MAARALQPTVSLLGVPLENLTAAVALHVGYYDLCRYHSAIRSTPVMAAGVTDHIWEVEELLEEAGALL